jgi:hypothetical protein
LATSVKLVYTINNTNKIWEAGKNGGRIFKISLKG